MDTESDWVPIATFNAQYEADGAIARLESEGIPTQRRNNDFVGIFGPGFGGPTAGGITVLVPGALADEALQVLSGE
jgi:hypothetical protein